MRRACADCHVDISTRGHQAIRCVECQKKWKQTYLKEYLKGYQSKHKERLRAYNHAYNLEYADKRRAYQRKRYAKNKERIKQKSKAYYIKNKEQISLRTKVYRKQYYARNKEWLEQKRRDYLARNPGVLQEQKHRRRARLSQVEHGPAPPIWELAERQDNRCLWCQQEFTLLRKPTLDHIVPISKGGGHVESNVQALCQSCNSRKGTSLPSELESPVAGVAGMSVLA